MSDWNGMDFPYLPIVRMGLEPKTSYSREVSGFLGYELFGVGKIYIYTFNTPVN